MDIEKRKNQIITELYESGKLQEKIKMICYQHRIPTDADIQSDILQVAMENLIKYDTNKFIEAYTDNPNRIIGLAVRIILRNGVYVDKRSAGGFKKSIAQQILHQSTYNTLVTVNTVDDIHDEFSKILKSDDTDPEEYETNYQNMWDYVRSNLNEFETMILNMVLEEKKPKGKKFKAEFEELKEKIKELINEFNEWKNNN